MARSLSQFPATASQPPADSMPGREAVCSGRGFSRRARHALLLGFRYVLASRFASFPPPQQLLACSRGLLPRPGGFSSGVFSACTVPAGCSVCWSCQEACAWGMLELLQFPRSLHLQLLPRDILLPPHAWHPLRVPLACPGWLQASPSLGLWEGGSFPPPSAPTTLLPPPASASPVRWPCSPLLGQFLSRAGTSPFPCLGQKRRGAEVGRRR